MNIHSYLMGILLCSSIGILNAKIIRVTDENNYKKIMESQNQPTLVEFAAEWCSVCTGIQKPLNEIANDPEFSHVAFMQVDVDKCDGLCKERGIVGVPTFVYINEGKEKVKETGVQKIEDFSSHIRNSLRQHFSVAQNMSNTNFMGQPIVEKEEQITITETTPMIPEQGMLARIVAMIMSFISSLFITIKNAFIEIIEALKGFFNK